MVKFTAVTKRYADSIAVNNLNLHIRDNEFVVLIGPSGCGKTTTLKMVNRLINPTSGTIEVGERISKISIRSICGEESATSSSKSACFQI